MKLPSKPYLPPHPIQHFLKFLWSDAIEDVMPLSLALIIMLCCFVDAIYFLYLN